jgi:hypothetical protein
MEFNAENHRRAGVRILRPWLGSARMVGLFYRIGMLAITRPGKLALIELMVDRLAQPSAVDAVLPADRQRKSG